MQHRHGQRLHEYESKNMNQRLAAQPAGAHFAALQPAAAQPAGAQPAGAQPAAAQPAGAHFAALQPAAAHDPAAQPEPLSALVIWSAAAEQSAAWQVCAQALVAMANPPATASMEASLVFFIMRLPRSDRRRSYMCRAAPMPGTGRSTGILPLVGDAWRSGAAAPARFPPVSSSVGSAIRLQHHRQIQQLRNGETRWPGNQDYRAARNKPGLAAHFADVPRVRRVEGGGAARS